MSDFVGDRPPLTLSRVGRVEIEIRTSLELMEYAADSVWQRSPVNLDAVVAPGNSLNRDGEDVKKVVYRQRRITLHGSPSGVQAFAIVTIAKSRHRIKPGMT